MTLARSAARRTSSVLLLAFCSAAIGAEVIRQPSYIRFITAACVGLAAAIAATQWPRVALVATLALLPYLAISRRILLEFAPWKSTDPLLLVAPAVVVLVLARLFVIERRPLVTDLLSKLMLFLLVLTFLEAFNPRGGGLKAGLGALLFAAVPLLWFFAGRELATERSLRVLFIILAVSGCLIATYGLVQTWSGLPSWDRLWVNTTGYAALNVGTVVRAFGTFSSAAEYASFLGLGIVVSVAFALDRRPYLLPTLPLLAIALFYESSRGIIVTTVAAILVVLAARTGSMRRASVTLIALFAIVVIGLVLERGALQSASSSSNALVSHQLSGLVHPLNSKQSTLPSHLSEVEIGFEHGAVDPIGHGIATITLAGTKLGKGVSSSTEVDLSNVFVADGTFGGLAYLAIVVIALVAALRRAVTGRDAVSLSILGMLVAVGGQWLNGGYYAVSPLIWFCIGYVIATTWQGPRAHPPEARVLVL
jgi:hypothetical protein